MAEEFSLTEWIKKAKSDPKLIAPPIVIVLGVIYGGYKFLYAPQVKALTKISRQMKGTASEVRNLRQAIENIEDIKLDVAEKKANLEKSLKLCYKKSEVTNYLRRVRELAMQAGIPVKSINPRPPAPVKVGPISAEQIQVAFNFSGDLVQLGTFLRLIEKEQKITYCDLPNLKPNASGTFDLVLLPTAIFMPDDVAEQIAKVAPSEEEE